MKRLTSFTTTDHCIQRQQQRQIAEYQIEFAIRHGTPLHIRGKTLYYVRNKDMPYWMDQRNASKLHGIVAVVSQDQVVVTAYRDPGCLRQLKKRAQQKPGGNSYVTNA